MNHFPIPRSQVDRIKFIIDFARGKSVLHLGCADYPYTLERLESGTWLHQMVSGVAASCLGVDSDEETVAWLRDTQGISNVIHGNAEKLDELDLGRFDVVLAGELIEHLNNPGMFLDSAKTVMKPEGRLLITTTKAFCFRRFIRIPFGIESIHPDHTYYFSHVTLSCLAQRFGFRLDKACSYRLPNRKPPLPYMVERLATVVTPNWGEGIVHVYSLPVQETKSP